MTHYHHHLTCPPEPRSVSYHRTPEDVQDSYKQKKKQEQWVTAPLGHKKKKEKKKPSDLYCCCLFSAAASEACRGGGWLLRMALRLHCCSMGEALAERRGWRLTAAAERADQLIAAVRLALAGPPADVRCEGN